MKFSHFFINKPVFASVISIIITLVGFLAYFNMPVTQYPNIVPPTVVVYGSYPGASPEVIINTTIAPIEQQLNGVEGMAYMSSVAQPSGSWTITVTFETGVNADIAQVLVQNKVSQSQSRVPQEVRDIGITVKKRSADLILTINLFSPNGTRDKVYLSNYAITQIQDRLSRVYGVSEFTIWGSKEYSMRIWLNPDRMSALGLSPTQVINALKEQNKQVAAGSLNKPPLETGAAYELLINAQGRLSNEKEFGNIVVKYMPDGRIVHLRDIARIELGAYTYENDSYLNMMPAITLGMYQLPGTNSIETAKRIFAELEEMKKTFPEDVDYAISYDATEYVKDSINAVYRSIFEAVALVVFVVLLFLKNWRAAIIPLFAIPVSLVGTFAMMYLFGFTINNLTLFGLVLAIGIVVDDAIVVVENVERNMADGASVKDAVTKAMTQIQGALIAIVLVLSAAFVPTAFLSGISGQFYRQFALTIATSTILSGLVSLTLTPALCALLLKHEEKKKTILALLWNYSIGLIINYFNIVFDYVAELYGKFVRFILRFSPLVLLLYVGMLWATFEIFKQTPSGFIPRQDRGSFNIRLELPEGASLERTAEIMDKAGRAVLGTEGARLIMSVIGDKRSNLGRLQFRLEDRYSRDQRGLSLQKIMADAYKTTSEAVIGAKINTYTPAIVPGMASGGDIKCQLQDRAGLGINTLQRYSQILTEEIEKLESVSSAYSTFRTTNPQLYIDIDRERAQKLNVSISSIFTTMQYNLGSVYVNDFNILGRVYRVMAQAESNRRKDISDVYRLKIPNALGQNVPLGSVATIKRYIGPNNLTRYNLYTSAEVFANVSQGFSSGEAMKQIEELAANILPQGMGIEWTDIAYEEKKAGNTSIYIFAVCVIFVFLLLSALYESWLLPLSVILIVPLVLLFAMIGINLHGFSNNLMAQIGFVVLIGLACKNAILIVEFAKQREDAGEDLISALATASKNRLRPIMMTSFAFILGVVPLAFGEGPGCELRQPLGTSVMYGMIGVTILGCIMTPVFYHTIRRLFSKPKLKKK